MAAAALVGIGGAWLVDSHRRAREASLVHRTMVELLLNTLCSGDPETARHSRRVADLTDAVGATYRMNREARARLRVAALLHDLGKLDDDVAPIVQSHHRLDPEERRRMNGHTYAVADILHPLEAIHPGIELIVESHHERWDGGGYPQHLSGAEIPLESRIISVADVFDALTQPRSYRDPLPLPEALEEIRGGSGTKFDPEVVARLDRPTVWRTWERVALRGQREERRIETGEESAEGCERTGTPAAARTGGSRRDGSA